MKPGRIRVRALSWLVAWGVSTVLVGCGGSRSRPESAVPNSVAPVADGVESRNDEVTPEEQGSEQSPGGGLREKGPGVEFEAVTSLREGVSSERSKQPAAQGRGARRKGGFLRGGGLADKMAAAVNEDTADRDRGSSRGGETSPSSIDRHAYRRFFARHHNEVKFCYEKSLAQDPQLKGKLVLKYVIGTDGKVLDVFEQSSSLGDSKAADQVRSCMVKLGKRWVFPKAGTVTRIVYPFVFHASPDD